MIPLAIALEAAQRMQPQMVQAAPETATCDASSAATEPSLSQAAPDCDDPQQSVAHTLSDPNHAIRSDEMAEHHRRHHIHFNPFGIFGHHRHHGGRRDAGIGGQDPMSGHEPPVTRISRQWHADYNRELRAAASDQVPLPEVSVRVLSMRADGMQRNVAHVIVPMRNADTMLTGAWELYKASDGQNRLVLNGTKLEIVATGEQPVARYTISKLLGYRRAGRGMEPVTRVTVFEAPIVTDGGAHRGYHVANLHYAIETEAVAGE